RNVHLFVIRLLAARDEYARRNPTHGQMLRAGINRRRGQDSNEASAEAEDGPTRCAAAAGPDAGESISADLGSELGEPRSAAIVVAPAPDGRDAYTIDESVASVGIERRHPSEERVVASRRQEATR